jgi:hypothetical protein
MYDLPKCSENCNLSTYAIILHAYNNWNDAIGETLINPLCLILELIQMLFIVHLNSI